MPSFVAVCESAARAGGQVLLDYFGRVTVREKGPSDLVTEADLAAQEAVWSHILQHFPDHGLLGEEGEEVAGADDRYRWIVDPLDGTTNYVHGVPQFAVSIAVAEADRVLAGAIFDPMAKECFTAVRGVGAYLNGQPIRASDITELNKALVVASFPAQMHKDDVNILRFVNVVTSAQSLRRTGSSAINLAYVACGRFDGFWATECKAWDVAAGLLLVREASGAISNLEGGPVDLFRPKLVAASTESLLGALRQKLIEGLGG